MELKVTDHSYYCSDSNYYVGNQNGENYGRSEHDTWASFKEAWFMGDKNDHDYNHCFRFDIQQKFMEETEEKIDGEYHLYLYFILQRKGIFRPVFIETITDADMSEVQEFLKSCWEYLKSQWEEVSVK